MPAVWQQLQERRAGMYAEQDTILEAVEAAGGEYTDEQRARMAELNTSVETITTDIEMSHAAARRAAGLPPEQPPAPAPGAGGAPAGEHVFGSLGEWAMALVAATRGDEGQRNRILAAASGMGEAIDSDGGFAVQPDLLAGVERRMHDEGRVLALLNPQPVSGNGMVVRTIDETSRADGSRNGAVVGYWLEEGEAPDTSKFKFARQELKLHGLGALAYVTDEMLQDAAFLGSELAAAFTEELIFKVEDAIIEGDGAGKPQGIIHATNGSKIEIAKETNQTAATINTKNISKMWARLHARSRANAVWMINQDVEPELDELSIAAGTAALEPRFVTYGPDGILRIKGRPVIVIEYASTLGTAGDIILADMSQYRLITKNGIEQASSMHVRFNNFEQTFRAKYRVDGQSKWKSALTPFKGTSSKSVSPFLTLADRS